MRTGIRAVRLLFHVIHGAFNLWWRFARVTPQEQDVMVSQWARSALDILNVRLVWRGFVPPRTVTSAVFVCNHISWLDVLALLAVRPVRFVAKSELRSWPVIGWMARKTGTIFLRRSQARHLEEVNRALYWELSQGRCVAIFPEGTTTDGSAVHPFHSGLFESVVQIKSSVWPMALGYQYPDGSLNNRAAFIHDQSFLSSAWRVLREPAIDLTVGFGAPLNAKGWERKELARAAHRAVIELYHGQGQLLHPELVAPVMAEFSPS